MKFPQKVTAAVVLLAVGCFLLLTNMNKSEVQSSTEDELKLVVRATLPKTANLKRLTTAPTPQRDAVMPVISAPSASASNLTVAFVGRFGNHMFLVASGYVIAQRNKMRFALPANNHYSSQLRLAFDGVRHLPEVPHTKSLIIAEFPRWGVFDPSAFHLSVNGSAIISGYMQSYKYFHDEQYRVLELFRFSKTEIDRSQRSIAQVTPKTHNSSTTVGIHVRRTDYASSFAFAAGYVTPDVEYYHRATQYFRNKYTHVLFIVVSDDLQWSRNHIKGSDVVFSSTGSPFTDMCILSKLDHIILSTGTYSWWAGYLNRGEKVYFRDIARNGSDLAKDFDPDDFFPTDWTRL